GNDPVHVAREVQHDGVPDRLPAEARSPAPRQDGNAEAGSGLHCGHDIVGVPREDDADRLDGVHAGVRRKEMTGICVELHFARESRGQGRFEVGRRSVSVTMANQGKIRESASFGFRGSVWRAERSKSTDLPSRNKTGPAFESGPAPEKAPETAILILSGLAAI